MVVEMPVVCGFDEQSMHIPRLVTGSQASSIFVTNGLTGGRRVGDRSLAIGQHVDKPRVLAYTQQENRIGSVLIEQGRVA